MTKAKKSKKPKADDFKSVAKRLECDEDKAAFEKKLGKIAKAKPDRSITDQIRELEKRLKTTVGLSPEAIAEREQIQRRLCRLQDIDFDAPDGLHEFD